MQRCRSANLTLWSVSTVYPRVLFERNADSSRAGRLLRHGEGGFGKGTDTGDELGRVTTVQLRS